MKKNFLTYYIIIALLLTVSGSIILYYSLPGLGEYHGPVNTEAAWDIPDIYSLPANAEGDLIRYGKELVANTAKYLGPKGLIAHMSNGMNCQNCHLDGGTRLNGNCFALVASTYPKFRPRSGRQESVEYRVNDCFERSLNGGKLDSLSREMRAIVAYLRWVGKNVPKEAKLSGMGIPELVLMQRAASVTNGAQVYAGRCVSCHGTDGQGQLNADSSGYTYPPLWGEHSYNVSAGIYRISRLAGYIKYNMPYTNTQTEPQLSDEEAWDLAAFISSQQRPQKMFTSDWPVITTKPYDHPFGPFADSFSVQQHKYGPFIAIKKAKTGK